MSSQDAVARVRRLAGERVGHGGTLDPDAAGVLPVAVGRARALIGRIRWEPKTSWARARAGSRTDTLDAAGRVVARSGPPWPGARDWTQMAGFLRGMGLAVPPARSAVSVGGERAHRLQRAGGQPPLAPRRVWIEALGVEAVEGAEWEFVATVGSGTYVRGLVRDWAEALGHAAHLVALIRTRCGPMPIAEAVTLETLERDGVEPHLWSWRRVWTGPVAVLADGEAQAIQQGQWPRALTLSTEGLHALTHRGRLVALAQAPATLVRVIPGGLA
jgi:tRNA pseudouridine55 synthase